MKYSSNSKRNMDNELKIYLEQNNLITKRSNYSPRTKSRSNKGNYNGCISNETDSAAPCYTNEYLTEDGLTV